MLVAASMTAIATTFGGNDIQFFENENKINVEILNEYIILKYANQSKAGFDCLSDINGISKHWMFDNFI